MTTLRAFAVAAGVAAALAWAAPATAITFDFSGLMFNEVPDLDPPECPRRRVGEDDFGDGNDFLDFSALYKTNFSGSNQQYKMDSGTIDGASPVNGSIAYSITKDGGVPADLNNAGGLDGGTLTIDTGTFTFGPSPRNDHPGGTLRLTGGSLDIDFDDDPEQLTNPVLTPFGAAEANYFLTGWYSYEFDTTVFTSRTDSTDIRIIGTVVITDTCCVEDIGDQGDEHPSQGPFVGLAVGTGNDASEVTFYLAGKSQDWVTLIWDGQNYVDTADVGGIFDCAFGDPAGGCPFNGDPFAQRLALWGAPNAAAAPKPASVALFGLGLAGLALLRRRRRRRA